MPAWVLPGFPAFSAGNLAFFHKSLECFPRGFIEFAVLLSAANDLDTLHELFETHFHRNFLDGDIVEIQARAPGFAVFFTHGDFQEPALSGDFVQTREVRGAP